MTQGRIDYNSRLMKFLRITVTINFEVFTIKYSIAHCNVTMIPDIMIFSRDVDFVDYCFIH